MMSFWLQGAMRQFVACSLFSSPQCLPMHNSMARVVRLLANAQGATCRIYELPEGRRATFVVQANTAEIAINIEVAQ